MEVTEVRVTLRDERKLKAFANITFDNSFVVRGLKVIKGSDGFFISMPSRKRSDGSHQDIAHPINADMRKHIERSVLDEYRKVSGHVVEEAVGSTSDYEA
jgi:stage V sporulation protein G